MADPTPILQALNTELDRALKFDRVIQWLEQPSPAVAMLERNAALARRMNRESGRDGR